MHYHIILTENCNLKCRYCYEKSMNEFDNDLDKKFNFDFSDPCDVNINLNELKNFLKQDKNPVLIFYGGEPLLKINKIIEIIDFLEDLNIKYRMQTNGILLQKLPIKYLLKIDKILISIDGDENITNFNRGNNVYKIITDNLFWARENGYDGEFVARMTISQSFPDVYKQVIHLISLVDNGLFSSIHWQIDAGFYKNDYNYEKIKKFFCEYNISVKKLINWWIEKLKNGKVYKIYPFIGIVKPILENKKGCGLRCGSGHSGYTITTSGKIVHCPIMNSIENFKAGTLNSNLDELKKFDCKQKCGDCEVYDLCGGRCMYWRYAELWPREGNNMICDSIKFYINEIKKNISEIKSLINKNILNKSDFNYEENFGPEIIP